MVADTEVTDHIIVITTVYRVQNFVRLAIITDDNAMLAAFGLRS